MAPRKKPPAEPADNPPLSTPEKKLAETKKRKASQAKAAATRNAKKLGRPSSYRPEYCARLLQYFSGKISYTLNTTDKGSQQVMPGSELSTFQGFAAEIGVTVDTLLDWTQQFPEFFQAYTQARQLQADQIMRATFSQACPPNFAALLLSNDHGYTTDAKAKARAKGLEEAEPESDGELPEATAFVVTVVKDRDDAFYQLWMDHREKNKLLGKDEDEGLENFELYDENDKDQLKEVAKVRGHLLGLLEMLPDE